MGMARFCWALVSRVPHGCRETLIPSEDLWCPELLGAWDGRGRTGTVVAREWGPGTLLWSPPIDRQGAALAQPPPPPPPGAGRPRPGAPSSVPHPAPSHPSPKPLIPRWLQLKGFVLFPFSQNKPLHSEIILLGQCRMWASLDRDCAGVTPDGLYVPAAWSPRGSALSVPVRAGPLLCWRLGHCPHGHQPLLARDPEPPTGGWPGSRW